MELLHRVLKYQALTALAVLGLLQACSVEKNTSLSRNYHNLTSHYNIYFNGREAYKKGLEKAHASVSNNYNQILPVFLYTDEAVHQAVNTDMKRAIDKSTKVITFHSITAKPKVKEGEQSEKDKAFYNQNEYNKWVDDSYMLMGRAYMYQGEFFLAAETFKHVLLTFPEEEIRFLAMAWLARAYIQIGELREAERILISLEDENEFPEEYLKDYHSSLAQLNIEKKAYASAAEHLELAMDQKKVKKSEKIRYTYILAQLYEELEDNNRALEKYKQVTRFNPPYEMAFNARVNMAEVYESGSAGSEELKKLLRKMLRDSKNKEYLDQIYFALGNIAMEEGDREQAISYYQQSVSSSLQNNYQKGFSSLTLANIYYEQPDYLLSAAYYDSAVSFLDKDYPGYQSVANLSASLGRLVGHVNTFELEDSVQILAALPEEERLAIIDGIIEEVKKSEEEARQAEQQAMQDMAMNQSMLYSNQNTRTSSAQQGGQWYFYNLNAKSFGQPEFRLKWGERKLEDNWRRKNKRSLSEMGVGPVAEGDSLEGGVTQVVDNKSREYYLVNIPLSDSAMQASNARLEEALFQMGIIYKDELLDYQESIEVFEELLQRFPGTRHEPPVLFYLYELFSGERNTQRADYYYANLVRRFPESHYAKLLTNPNYLEELEAEEMKVTRYYEETFSRYQAKDYAAVIARADEAIRQYPGDALIPKFKYIKAMASGVTAGKQAMKDQLDSLIIQHPGVEESLQAQEIIDFMYVEFPEIQEADQAQQAEELFAGVDSLQKHFFMLAVPKAEDVNRISFNLLNYNLDHFNQYDLSIQQVDMDDAYALLVVHYFNQAEAAQRYLEVIASSLDEILAGISGSRVRIMLISEENYQRLSETREVGPYYQFYQKHY